MQQSYRAKEQFIEAAPVITVDGPSSSGKGTISRLLADKLGWHFLDSGAVYRAFALASLKHGISLDDLSALKKLAANLKVQFVFENSANIRVLLEHADVTDDIRSEQCGIAASRIAALPSIRRVLLELQKSFRKFPGLVADGRDMGTVVFPDAIAKIFLTANSGERAKRRYLQLKEQRIHVSLRNISLDLAKRDARDTKRDVSPLKPAKDAHIIDTTNLSIDDVLQKVLDIVMSAIRKNGAMYRCFRN